jgi:hypothetical protein
VSDDVPLRERRFGLSVLVTRACDCQADFRAECDRDPYRGERSGEDVVSENQMLKLEHDDSRYGIRNAPVNEKMMTRCSALTASHGLGTREA